MQLPTCHKHVSLPADDKTFDEIMKTLRAKIDGFGFTIINCENC